MTTNTRSVKRLLSREPQVVDLGRSDEVSETACNIKKKKKTRGRWCSFLLFLYKLLQSPFGKSCSCAHSFE